MTLSATVPPDRAVIRLVDVHKRFGDLVVLDGVDLAIERGITTVILGPSGTGKSVMFKLVVGLLEPDEGEVWVGEVDMARATERARYAARRRLGMMFQGGALFDGMTAWENVAFPLRWHARLSEDQMRARAVEKLDWVGLADFADTPTPSLSGGQRKRVSLARAIVLDPEIVLFDEPTSGLDPLTSNTIDELVAELKHRLGITFVVITHDILSAVSIGDRIGMLSGGKLVAYAPTADFVRSDQPVVRAFLERYLELGDDGSWGRPHPAARPPFSSR